MLAFLITGTNQSQLPIMKKTVGYLVGVVLIFLVVVVAHERRDTRLLQARIAEAKNALDCMARERQALADEVARLNQVRKGDRALIGQLWDLAHNARSKPAAMSEASKSSEYDISKLKDMAATSGGNLDRVIHRILTPDRLHASLERHAAEPAFWVAAASMCKDLDQARQYLETAAARFPESAIAQAALIESRKGESKADATTRMAIANLRKADPTSSLADHYEAYFQFKNGDSAAGLQALAAASEKDRHADHRMELMMNRYQCLLENGCSDGGALALSAFTLSFDHLPMVREVSRQALDQVQAASAAGQTELALQPTDYLLRIGRNLSASGRFLVYDRVGMELQQAALAAQHRLYDSAGNTAQVREVDAQLGAVRARAVQINAMAAGFGGVLAQMTDQEIVHYIESTLLQGEFATLQRMKPTP